MSGALLSRPYGADRENLNLNRSHDAAPAIDNVQFFRPAQHKPYYK